MVAGELMTKPLKAQMLHDPIWLVRDQVGTQKQRRRDRATAAVKNVTTG